MVDPQFASPADCLKSTATEWGSSRFGEWFRCQQGHHLRYHLRIARAPHVDSLDAAIAGEEPDGKPEGLYFEVGSLVHGAINWLSDGLISGQPGRQWQDVTTAAASYQDPERPKGFDLGSVYEAQRLLGAYFVHYGDDNAGWHPDHKLLAVELQLVAGETCARCAGRGLLLPDDDRQGYCADCGGHGVTADSPFRLPYTAAADALLQCPSGEILIADTKTRAKSFPADAGSRQRYARGLATRGQFAGLSWLVRRELKLDYNPAVLVNGIVKTKIPKFDRLRVDLTDADLAFWEESHRAAAATGLTGSVANHTACSPEMGSRCWAFDWCHGSAELKDRKFVVRE